MLLSFPMRSSLCAPYTFFCFFYFCLAAIQMAVVAAAMFKGRNICLSSYPLPLVPPAPTALHDRTYHFKYSLKDISEFPQRFKRIFLLLLRSSKKQTLKSPSATESLKYNSIYSYLPTTLTGTRWPLFLKGITYFSCSLFPFYEIWICCLCREHRRSRTVVVCLICTSSEILGTMISPSLMYLTFIWVFVFCEKQLSARGLISGFH